MSMSDPISDLLTRIRNDQGAGKPEVSLQSSRVKLAIVKVLKDEGYISDFAVTKDGGKATLTIALKYHAGKPVIERLERPARVRLGAGQVVEDGGVPRALAQPFRHQRDRLCVAAFPQKRHRGEVELPGRDRERRSVRCR